MPITKELLAAPEIYLPSVEDTIVCQALTEAQQNIVRRATTENEKFNLVCQFGDESETVRQIHLDLIIEPAERREAGLPFPYHKNIETTIFFEMLDEAQKNLVRNAKTDAEKRYLTDSFIRTGETETATHN